MSTYAVQNEVNTKICYEKEVTIVLNENGQTGRFGLKRNTQKDIKKQVYQNDSSQLSHQFTFPTRQNKNMAYKYHPASTLFQANVYYYENKNKEINVNVLCKHIFAVCYLEPIVQRENIISKHKRKRANPQMINELEHPSSVLILIAWLFCTGK